MSWNVPFLYCYLHMQADSEKTVFAVITSATSFHNNHICHIYYLTYLPWPSEFSLAVHFYSKPNFMSVLWWVETVKWRVIVWKCKLVNVVMQMSCDRLSPWLSGLMRFLSHSACWAWLADDYSGLGSNPGWGGFHLVGLMAGMLWD